MVGVDGRGRGRGRGRAREGKTISLFKSDWPPNWPPFGPCFGEREGFAFLVAAAFRQSMQRREKKSRRVREEGEREKKTLTVRFDFIFYFEKKLATSTKGHQSHL